MKKRSYSNIIFYLFICVFFVNISTSAALQNKTEEENPEKLKSPGGESIEIKGQWFLGYQNGQMEDENINEFLLKRGYITFRKRFTDWLSARFTQDVSLDREGDGRGDIELRLKYAYLKVSTPEFWFLNDPYLEIGLVHRPWLDFEEHINEYRLQGTMYLERSHLLNSADYGVTFFTLFGGKMPEKYQNEVNKTYPGRYGSFSVGVYNGGGYHAIEDNSNKLVETRLTIRPVPEIIPGLQFSYYGVFGRGNTAAMPDFVLNNFFASYENPFLVATAQYYFGQGNSRGSFIYENEVAADNNGYSIFAEVQPLEYPVFIFGRYDRFLSDLNDLCDERIIAGISYKFYKKNKVIFDLDRMSNNSLISPEQNIYEIAVEVHF